MNTNKNESFELLTDRVAEQLTLHGIEPGELRLLDMKSGAVSPLVQPLRLPVRIVVAK